MPISPHRRLLLPLCLLLLLTAPAVPPAAQEPVAVGATLSSSGPYRQPAEMIRRGYRMWAREVNERGGLLGRPVELIILDDAGEPEKVRSGYRSLIEERGAELLLSPYGTPLTLAASEVSEEAGKVMVASGAAGRSIWERGHRYIFGTYATADRFFIGFLDLVARQGLERVGILYEMNPFNQDAARGAAEWLKKLGLQLSGSLGFYPNSLGKSEYIQRLKDGNTEALVVCSYPEEGYRVLDLLTEEQWRPAALAMTITPIHPDFRERAGDAAEGVFAPSQWEPMERIPFPGTSRFLETFRQRYGTDPSYHAASAYASCQILERAVTATGSLEHERLRRHILSMDTVTIIGRFKVDATGRQVGHNPLIIQWQEGEKEIVYPRLLQTAPPRFPREEETR